MVHRSNTAIAWYPLHVTKNPFVADQVPLHVFVTRERSRIAKIIATTLLVVDDTFTMYRIGRA